MKRVDLEHILRACSGVTGETEFIVVGSQAVLGRFPDAPRVLRRSMEADVYPRFQPELSELIEGSLGRYSQFDTTYGYHADGVSPTTATLPKDWEERLVRVSNENTGHAIGWCLDPVDIAYSKLAARREKDLAFVAELIRHRMIHPSTIDRLIAATEDEALTNRLSEAWQICRRRAAEFDDED
ncbi:MAG: hypothetical protein ACI8QF_000851 [Limisphaerales bacterium]|jgi:hypothetical protein